MTLLRFILVSIIVYLIIRSFVRFLEGESPRSENNPSTNQKPEDKRKTGVPRELGEYVDYEEIKD